MVGQNIFTSKGKARIYKGISRGNIPKTYKKVDVLSHNLGNDYNSDLLTLFKARDGSLRYEIYRDGNFFPYYGRFLFVDKKNPYRKKK